MRSREYLYMQYEPSETMIIESNRSPFFNRNHYEYPQILERMVRPVSGEVWYYQNLRKDA